MSYKEKAESAVKIANNLMRKWKQDGGDSIRLAQHSNGRHWRQSSQTNNVTKKKKKLQIATMFLIPNVTNEVTDKNQDKATKGTGAV